MIDLAGSSGAVGTSKLLEVVGRGEGFIDLALADQLASESILHLPVPRELEIMSDPDGSWMNVAGRTVLLGNGDSVPLLVTRLEGRRCARRSRRRRWPCNHPSVPS